MTSLPEIDEQELVRRIKIEITKDMVKELINMVNNDPNKGTENQGAFLDEATSKRTREIGEQLRVFGGEDLMGRALNEVANHHGGMSARCLDAAWDGIGDWRG